ncbi:carbohydrate ABC transporter permease [Deinococcus pimensis]|uniref:carbohydrate ABC transporter permease n=1 Tax=Deinococcus pimensis TaxID=309888 RepID=UPI0004839772|nr:carbohydrate ABC transporter permease [Deinococcus pimensis]
MTVTSRPPFRVRDVLRTFALLLLAALFLLPFLLVLRNAFATDAQITAPQTLVFPFPPHVENIPDLLSNDRVNILTGLRNSTVIAVLQTFFTILFSSMAGYGLARVPFRGRDVVFAVIIATMMIPGAALFVPQYVLVAKLGWVNTLQGIVVPGLFSAFNCFMFRQFYLDFPKELEEAGRVDGLSWLGIFRFLALPNSRGIITALGLLTFIGSWNAFLWPLVIGQDASLWTVQVGISTLLTAQTVKLSQLFLASLFAILPLVVIFLVGQRWIAEGVKMSGSKG